MQHHPLPSGCRPRHVAVPVTLLVSITLFACSWRTANPDPVEQVDQTPNPETVEPNPETVEPNPETVETVNPPTPAPTSIPDPPEDAYVLGPIAREPATPPPTLTAASGIRVHVERREGGAVRSLTLEPAEVTLDLYSLASPHFVAHDQRDQVGACETREWQYEYARVANAALPLDALAFHIGRERFCDGVSFDGVQVRGYLLDSSVAEVVEAIRRGAGAEIGRLPGRVPLAERDAPAGPWSPQRVFEDWTSVLVRYNRYYDDYGGQAQMDFHVRRHGEHTVVILLMYVHSGVYEAGGVRTDPIGELMRSVRPRAR